MQGTDSQRDVYINGRCLTQRIGGVQRFARELIAALDSQLSNGTHVLCTRRWILLVPEHLSLPIELRFISVKVIGGLTGHLWDQLVLPWVTRRAILINLTNSAPILHPRCVVIIHDAAVFRTPGNFSATYAFVHRTLDHILARTCLIGTVSQFSRTELATILRIDHSKIFVVSNSCEHLRNMLPRDGVLQRLGVKADKFFLLVGQPSPNKNFAMAVTAFSRLGLENYNLVIVGAADAAVFRCGIDQVPEGVIIAGHLPDPELVALFRSAVALVFPSVYEGFGIPPLEGMVQGCPVLASHIPPVVEVCGDAAIYFDPTQADSIGSAMRSLVFNPTLRVEMKKKGLARTALYSWRSSSYQLLNAVASLEKKPQPIEQ